MIEGLSSARLWQVDKSFLCVCIIWLGMFVCFQAVAEQAVDGMLPAGPIPTEALSSEMIPAGVHERSNSERQLMTNTLGMQMIWIEPGTYWRGSPPDEIGRRPNETLHQVTITSGFWLGKHEVTQAQYEAVMGENPAVYQGTDRPVDSVPWYDWIVFCNLLSKREGLQPPYKIDGVRVDWDRSANGYRLPTEAEWEYACRAGTKTRFQVGDEASQLEEVAWYRTNAQGQTHPVGTKPANNWGLHDMHGNVWEWCWDWYESYAGEPLIDPVGPAAGGRRILRGGGWRSYPTGCRSAYRLSGEPSMRREWFGARVARGALGGHEQ